MQQPVILRDIRWDIMKVLAAIGVVAIHTIAAPNLYAEHAGVSWIGSIMNACSRWAVPAFIMISAVTLMTKTKDLAYFYRHRVQRLFFPIASWSAIYMGMRVFRENATWDSLCRDLFSGQPYYHLWFVYMLIVFYLFLPGVVWLAQKMNPWCCLGLGSCIVFSTEWVGGWIWGVWPYLGYGLISISIYRMTAFLQEKTHARIVSMCALLLLSALATVFMVLAFQMTHDKAVFLYFTKGVFVQSVALFSVFCLSQFSLSSTLSTCIKKCADLTFGVYLIHPFVKGGVSFFNVAHVFKNEIVAVVINFLFIFVLSFLVTYVFSRVRILKTCVGF